MQHHDWKPHTTTRDVSCQTLYTNGILKHEGWLIKYQPSQLIVRDYPIIHSMWFDFEADTGAKGIAVPVDEYGNNDRIRPVDSGKTLLDVVAGDELFNYDSVLKLTKVAIFRATPAPVVTADKPVFEVESGKDWLDQYCRVEH